MSIARVCETTGLDEAEASLAKHRLGSEPLLWKDTEQAFER